MLDIQTDLVSRLARAFPQAVVKRFVPEKLPELLITVRREGGHRQNGLVDAPGVGIEVWGPSEVDASGTADEVADFLATLEFSEGYASIVQEAMYSSPDPDTDHPRWYLSYTFQTYQPPKGALNGY